MIFQNYPFFYLFFLSACITGFIAYFSWKHRSVRSAKTFSILMGLITWWFFFYGFEVLSADPDLQSLFLRIEYLAIPWISGFLVLFSLKFAGYEKYCTGRYLALIFLIPSVIFFGFFTDGIFHLYYDEYTFLIIDDLLVLSIKPGILYNLLVFANITSILFCFVFIFKSFMQSPGIFRAQILLTLAALTVALIGFLAFFMVPRPYPNFDIQPIFYTIVGALLLTALFRFQFLDLIQIPYHSIFNNLEEGIIVLDAKYRIIQVNKKASELLDLTPDLVIGQEILTVNPIFTDKSDLIMKDSYSRFQMDDTLEKDTSLFFEMYPVYDSSDRLISRMILVRDITEITRKNTALKKAGEKLNLLNSITRHDILNQVAILSGYAEIMANYPMENKKCEDYLVRIQNASDAVKTLIQFTATYQDLGIHKPVWLNARVIAKKAWNTLHPPESVTLTIDTDLQIFADMLLEKVFFNLMENSLRHGSSVTKISLSSYHADEHYVLVYEDDGIGIEPCYKNDIFSRGWGKNTGYGLFLAAEILSITSIGICETGTYGEGVRFEMEIPHGGAKPLEKGD